MIPIWPTMHQQFPASERDLLDFLDSLDITPDERARGLAYLHGPNDVCIAEDCYQPAKARNLCQKHYDQWRSRNRVLVAKRPKCIMDGCDKPTKAKSRCETHYRKLLREEAKAA